MTKKMPFSYITMQVVAIAGNNAKTRKWKKVVIENGNVKR